MTEHKEFWDKRADKYSQRPVADETSYQKKLEITREYFREDMEVLEIGCGTGSTALAHAPYVKHIRATDIAPRMIEIAKGKANAAGITNATFEVQNADELGVPDASLDAVMAHNLLHLLDDRERVIKDVYQKLKPGGVFVTSTACIRDMMFLLRLIVPVGRFLRIFPPVNVFSAADLRAEMQNAGFEIDHEWLPKRQAAVFMVCRKP
jgi:ubiquinone/menaquinone biosynthesis C-methylase UbiE